MQDTLMIGFHGPAGSGKDTMANGLQLWLGTRNSEIRAFASPLKRMMAAANWPEPANRDLKEAYIEGFDFSWRQAAQTLGTEWGRALDSDLWVKLATQNPCKEFTIFSDVRFDNEAKYIADYGGIVIDLQGRSASGVRAHVSEQGVKPQYITMTHNNSGPLEQSLETLFAKLEVML